MKKRLLALLSAIVLMGSVSLAENTEESAETPATAEPMVSLPIDFSPGMPADPDGFTLGDGTWSYEDPTISVHHHPVRHQQPGHRGHGSLERRHEPGVRVLQPAQQL